MQLNAIKECSNFEHQCTEGENWSGCRLSPSVGTIGGSIAGF